MFGIDMLAMYHVSNTTENNPKQMQTVMYVLCNTISFADIAKFITCLLTT